MFCHIMKIYLKGYHTCFVSEAVKQKLYVYCKSSIVLTKYWKNLSIDFRTGLSILANWKKDNWNSILVIIDRLSKIFHYKMVKTIIDALDLARVIIDVIVLYHNLLHLIIINKAFYFNFRYWSWLCYFVFIKY